MFSAVLGGFFEFLGTFSGIGFRVRLIWDVFGCLSFGLLV